METNQPSAEDVCELLQRERIVEAPEGLQPDDNLFAAGLDSMAVMQLMVVIEEAYGVMIEPGDLTKENLGTAASVASLVRGKM